MGLYTLIHGGSFPIAAPLIGAVAERWSVSTAFFVWSAGGLATLAVLTALGADGWSVTSRDRQGLN
jgi:hypothetical protein